MLRSHISKASSAYCHNELAPEDSRRFAEHLIGCGPCRLEFDEIKLGARFAGQLQVFSAPDSLWPQVAAGLTHKTRSTSRYHLWKPVVIAAAVVLLVMGGVLLLHQPRTNPQSGWLVARLGGAPRIGSQSISDKGTLSVGQWLETDSISRAKLDVADIGDVEIDPNTRVRLLQSSADEHRLELARGRLSARISAPPRLFFVNTPSGVAEDLGCAYSLEVDENGNSLVHVTAGWVAMQLNGRESEVPAGAACATRKGVGPGTPYFEDATENFRSALTRVDFDRD